MKGLLLEQEDLLQTGNLYHLRVTFSSQHCP